MFIRDAVSKSRRNTDRQTAFFTLTTFAHSEEPKRLVSRVGFFYCWLNGNEWSDALMKEL